MNSIPESGATLRLIKVRRDDKKLLVVAQTCVQQAKVDGLEISLKEAQSAFRSTEEHVSQFTNKTVVASVHHFEEERRLVALLYPHMDLSPLDPFKGGFEWGVGG